MKRNEKTQYRQQKKREKKDMGICWRSGSRKRKKGPRKWLRAKRRIKKIKRFVSLYLFNHLENVYGEEEK